ncbi:hypothetical protein HQ571_05570 [Candidatus Kuenenbacteria bacterium]|nr:hypothetical protein [Candidatus Kuenenbacteria bacterium]
MTDDMNRISFEYEGRKYTVGMEAYEDSLPIKLPDGRFLLALGWNEAYPPQPGGFKPYNPDRFTEAVDAETMDSPDAIFKAPEGMLRITCESPNSEVEVVADFKRQGFAMACLTHLRGLFPDDAFLVCNKEGVID